MEVQDRGMSEDGTCEAEGEDGYREIGEVGRLREEAEHSGEAALQGLLTCRLHISELQSSLILLCWVTEAPPL